MADITPDQATILRVVRMWPRAQQARLARMLLGDIKESHTINSMTGRPHVSSEEMRGLLATPGKPPPTDEDIEQIHMEKYGY